MVNIVRGKVDVGDIVGFITPFSPYSSVEFALVLNDHKIIPVRMDEDQIEYVKQSHRLGKKIAIGFYGGRWHIGIPERYSAVYRRNEECPAYDLLEEDIRYLQDVRQDFSRNVDELLERLGLSHLKAARIATND